MPVRESTVTTTYRVITPVGMFQAKRNGHEGSRVQYSGSADAIAYFKDYLASNSILGTDGTPIRFETLALGDLYRFCQSEKAGISVIPSLDDLMSESDESETDDGLVFNLFIEEEFSESISKEGGEASDGDFLALASTGDVDFFDKKVTDRLAALANRYTAPESAYFALIMQAKTAAKNFFITEFKKTVARYE